MGRARGVQPLLLALAFFAGFAIVADRPAQAEVRGEDLTVSLVTFGPGTHPFLKFGHNAFLIERPGAPGVVYNFGMFDFSSALIPKFILGRSHYWLARSERERTFAHYVEDNRTVELDELALTPAERYALWARLEENARPQNREYLYDYFYDNCSTRVRDALDVTIGGRLRSASDPVPARLSFRGHALRLVADLTWEYLALYYALGLPSDKRGTRWDEAFVPMELRDFVRTVNVPGDTPGAVQPLSRSHRVLFRSTRPPELVDPPGRLGYFLGLGLGLGVIFALLGFLGRTLGSARAVFAALAAVVGLIAGLCGILLLFFWIATNHRVAHANANVLQSVPWAIVLVAFVIGIARRRQRTLGKAFAIAATAAGASLLGVGARVSGLLPQDNTSFIALFLPLWLGLAVGLSALRRGAETTGREER